VPADEAIYRALHADLASVLCRLTDRVETAGLGKWFADLSDLRVPSGYDAAASFASVPQHLFLEFHHTSNFDRTV